MNTGHAIFWHGVTMVFVLTLSTVHSQIIYNLIHILFLLAVFKMLIVLNISGTRTKKLPMKLQRKAIVNNFWGGSQYERFEG